MTPVFQRTTSDCSQAAFASLLNRAYDEIPAMCGLQADTYNAAIIELLRREGLFILSIPRQIILEDTVKMYPGKTQCLLTVSSARFPGKSHHVCGEIVVWEKDGLWHWEANVTHDPYKLVDTYEVLTVDFVFKAIK